MDKDLIRENQSDPPQSHLSEARPNLEIPLMETSATNSSNATVGSSSAKDISSSTSSVGTSSLIREDNADDVNEKHCWVCFANEEDDPVAVWTTPCRCRGTTKWVHQACIQRWVDEKQKGSYSIQVECPQCETPYIIKFPSAPYMVAFLDYWDQCIQRLSPVITAGVAVASIYWSCVTYGAVTVMQCMGHDQGLILIERLDPLLLLVALPLVPVSLCTGKMIRWDEPVLKFLRKIVPKIPLSRYILPSFGNVPTPRSSLSSASLPPVSENLSLTRTMAGALILPTVASFLGCTVFRNVYGSNLRKTFYGGVTFILIKGIFKIYHKQHIFLRHGQRLIMDYEEKNSPKKSNSANSVRAAI